MSVPAPLAVDGVVANDVAARTLVVRLSENAEGYARLLWQQGYQALAQAEESGYRSKVPTVWG
jgi:hypothetical protein